MAGMDWNGWIETVVSVVLFFFTMIVLLLIIIHVGEREIIEETIERLENKNNFSTKHKNK